MQRRGERLFYNWVENVRARAQGKRLGRPTKLNPAQERRIREMPADGVDMIKIGKTVGVGRGRCRRSGRR